MQPNKELAQLLDQYTTPQQYKMIKDYKQIGRDLERHQRKKKQAAQHIEELEKKVSLLQLRNKGEEKESMRYQRQLSKLEDTQAFATELLKMKYQSFVELQAQKTHRQNDCMTKRENLWRNRRLAASLHDRRKKERIERVKEEQQRYSLDQIRRSGEAAQKIREQKEKIKDQQIDMKQRKHRYERFLMERAAYNYYSKFENELARYKDNSRQLQELKAAAQKEEQLFKKTQVLKNETSKIESIYLTGGE